MKRITYKCDSCIRYSKVPLWGHNMCSYHRACTKNTLHWQPENCQICMTQLDRLELMSEGARDQSIAELRRMLMRTQASKANRNISNWSYQQILKKYIGGYESQTSANSSNHNTPEENREDNYTPFSEARMVSGPMSSRDSDIQTTVEIALDHLTRKIIDKDINAEEMNLRDTSDRAHSSQHETLPTFRTIQSHKRSRRDQFESDTRERSNNPHLRKTPQYIYVKSSDPSRRKRPRSIASNYERVNDRYLPENTDYDRNDNDNHSDADSSNSMVNTNNGQYESTHTDRDSYYGDYQDDVFDPIQPRQPYHDNNTTLIDLEDLVRFDEFSNLPWFKLSDVHQRIDDRRVMVNTTTGRKCIEVIFDPNDPTWWQAKSNATKSKVAPFMGGIEAYNIILKAYEDVTPSDTVSPNKAIRLVDSEIKPNSYMNDLLQLIKTHNYTLTSAASKKNRKDILNAMPDTAFESNIIVNFTQGWCLGEGEQFKDWVKDKQLSIDEFSNQIRSFDKVKVDGELLAKERSTRRLVAAQLTSIHLAELNSRKIGKVDDKTKITYKLSSEESKAQARLLLDVLRSLITDWMLAKMEVRRAILENTSLETVVWLLKSNLWSHNIFPQEAINTIRSEGLTNVVKTALGMNKPSTSGSTYNQLPPSKKARYDIPGYLNSEYNRYQDQNKYQFQYKLRGGRQTSRGNRRQNTNRRGGNRGPGRYQKDIEGNH